MGNPEFPDTVEFLDAQEFHQNAEGVEFLDSQSLKETFHMDRIQKC